MKTHVSIASANLEVRTLPSKCIRKRATWRSSVKSQSASSMYSRRMWRPSDAPATPATKAMGERKGEAPGGANHLPAAAAILDISTLLCRLLPVQYCAGAIVGILCNDGDTIQHGADSWADSGLGAPEPLGPSLGGCGLNVYIIAVGGGLLLVGRWHSVRRLGRACA